VFQLRQFSHLAWIQTDRAKAGWVIFAYPLVGRFSRNNRQFIQRLAGTPGDGLCAVCSFIDPDGIVQQRHHQQSFCCRKRR